MKTKEYKLYGGHNRVVHHIQAPGISQGLFLCIWYILGAFFCAFVGILKILGY